MRQASAYYWRVLKTAGKESVAFAKRRLIYGLLTGVVVSGASWRFGLVNQIPNVLVRGLTILVGSYIAVFLGAFLIQLVAAPASLDKLAADQIDKKNISDKFVELMGEGEALADELRRGVGHYGRWLEKRQQWRGWVNQALVESGYEIDAATFRHASEPTNAKIPPGQVADGPFYRQLYGDELEKSRTALSEIVQRKLG